MSFSYEIDSVITDWYHTNLRVGMPFSGKLAKTDWYRYQNEVVVVHFESIEKRKLIHPGLVS